MQMPALALTLALSLPAAPVAAESSLPSIEERAKGLARIEGFVPLHWDEAGGKLLLELDPAGRELLYQVSLASGLGSNPVGLDRGQLGGTHVVSPRRVGRRLLLVERNHRFRARSANPDEVRAVEEAFTPSVLWEMARAAWPGASLDLNAHELCLRTAAGRALPSGVCVRGAGL